jgi:hypothetical protein
MTIRVEVEIRATATRVLARVLNRACTITRGVESAHQRLRVHPGVWITRHQPATRSHSIMYISGFFLPRGQREQRANVGVIDFAPAFSEPVTEIGLIVQMKSIEKRTGVKAHDVLWCVGRDRAAQLVQIAGQTRWIQ